MLHALRDSKLGEDAYVVRLSDHGGMAMSHGLQRQTMYTMYEETLNVPFVISHTRAKELGLRRGETSPPWSAWSRCCRRWPPWPACSTGTAGASRDGI